MSKLPTLILGATSAVICLAASIGDVALAGPTHYRCHYGCVAPSRAIIEGRTAYAPPPVEYYWGWPYGYGFGGPAMFHFPPVRSWGQGLGGFGPGW